jgi:hypothetical protein
MATISIDQLELIIKNNPNKQLVDNAQAYCKKLQLNVLGVGINSALTIEDYFESTDIFNVRNKNATSNADLFERILHREEMVFTAKGGATFYVGLNDNQNKLFDGLLDEIRFSMPIRKWIKEFALQAYRVDPMSVLFVEMDGNGKPYPTYKSSSCIYDYLPNGRQLEYVCFKLSVSEARQFLTDAGIDYSIYPELIGTGNITLSDKATNFYRFIDDGEDRIVRATGVIEILDTKKLPFLSVPGIIASDIIDFMNNQNFLSPLNKTIELATTYLKDRSIRDLSKKYSGFPKAYEPLLQCGMCKGTGTLAAKPCPECTTPGADRGTGYKLRTKVSDIARFAMPKDGQSGSFDPSRFFGYITPDIQTWDKQDTSLNDIESAVMDTYWGTNSSQSTTGPTVSGGTKSTFHETATKTLADLQPIYARLNKTADWAENTENALCNFIGYAKFKGTFKKSSRTYGRYYILETPDELMEQYLDMKTKGAPQTTLFDVLRKYYHAVYENDGMQLNIKLKLIDVEPFVHQTIVQVQANNPSRLDFFMKLYYSEWLASKEDIYLISANKEALLLDLSAYANLKMVLPAELLTPPTIGISETIKNTN